MSDDQKKPKPGYSPASINREAVFWLNCGPEARERIARAGGCPPSITGDDHFVAAQQRNEEIASPALGNNAKRARDLLCLGADVGHDFNAAVQNAARGGHEDVIKLVMVADKEFFHARNDAYMALVRSQSKNTSIGQLLKDTCDDDAVEKIRKDLHKQFSYSVSIGRPKDAAVVLDQMVALMFPKAPTLG